MQNVVVYSKRTRAKYLAIHPSPKTGNQALCGRPLEYSVEKIPQPRLSGENMEQSHDGVSPAATKGLGVWLGSRQADSHGILTTQGNSDTAGDLTAGFGTKKGRDLTSATGR